MPTVRANIKPLAVFPAPVGKPERGAFTIYPAHHWDMPGLYRVMVGEKWLTRDGEGKKAFYDEQGLASVFACWGLGVLGISPDVPNPGTVPVTAEPGTYVWLTDKADGADHPARTNSYPFQDKAGNWYVYLLYPKRGQAVALDYLTLRKRESEADNG